MNCMKCGREIEADQVFCETCLEQMENYPVKPDIAVRLPQRSLEPAAKKSHRRKHQNLSPEEQVVLLQKRFRAMAAAFLLMLLISVGLGILAGVTIKELDVQKLLGQNYQTAEAETTEATESAEAPEATGSAETAAAPDAG